MTKSKQSLLVRDERTTRRNAAEVRFRTYGLCAIGIAALALIVLLTAVVSSGVSAFRQTYITLEITLLETKLDETGTRDPEVIAKGQGHDVWLRAVAAGRAAEPVGGTGNHDNFVGQRRCWNDQQGGGGNRTQPCAGEP